MTVAEARKVLEKMPSNAVLFTIDAEEGMREVKAFGLEKAYLVQTVNQGQPAGHLFWSDIKRDFRLTHREVEGVYVEAW